MAWSVDGLAKFVERFNLFHFAFSLATKLLSSPSHHQYFFAFFCVIDRRKPTFPSLAFAVGFPRSFP